MFQCDADDGGMLMTADDMVDFYSIFSCACLALSTSGRRVATYSEYAAAKSTRSRQKVPLQIHETDAKLGKKSGPS